MNQQLKGINTVFYGNTGCGVFKGCILNLKGFWLKINFSQIKLSNLENRSSGELSKVIKFDFKSQFSMSKIIRTFLDFIFN